MDTTQTITHVGLCAGYGGIELGVKRIVRSLRTVALCEIEAFADANLVSKMEAGLLDPAPIWTNLKTFPWGAFRDRVDVLTGGYPCQPFSAAGKRLGKDDPRHLWPWIADGIDLMRPRLVFLENVEGHISLGLREVLEDLESRGYKATWGIFSAAEVGAPHQRKRVFVMAYLRGEGLQGNIARLFASSGWEESSRPISGCGRSSGEGSLANTDGAGSGEDRQSTKLRSGRLEQSSIDRGEFQPVKAQQVGTPRDGDLENSERVGLGTGGSSQPEPASGRAFSHHSSSQAWPSRPGEPQYGWEPPRVVGNSQGERSATCGPEHEKQLGEDDVASAGSPELGNTSSDDERRISESAMHGERQSVGGSNSDVVANAECSERGKIPSSAHVSDGKESGRNEGPSGTGESGEVGDSMQSGSSPERKCEGKQDALGEPSSMADCQCDRQSQSEGGKREQRRRTVNGGENMVNPSSISRTNLEASLRTSPEQAEPRRTGGSEIESSLGGDADGASDWMDYAQLCVSCDNRIDELRSCGNGVVPATAERAFRVLYAELSESLTD